MRKIVILAAVLLSTQVFGQRVPLSGQSKSEAITKVRLQQMRNGQRSEWQKNTVAVGKNGEVKLIAKVGRGFDARRLAEYGITVGAMAGDIVTLRVPIDKIDVLDANPSILQYCLSERVQPTMNRTRKDTRTDSVQQGLGLPQAYTGKDVLIGITDWGFDYKHPNFNNNGESNRRLLRAWDQFKLSGPAPEGFDYGTEHVGRSALLRAEGDTSGLYGYGTHGTHVAGIAAGRGIDGNYTGQAPYANLLFASFYLDLGSWIDAVGWMKNVAREEGKRLVVNNSWGMYTLGPIDGTSLASQAINNWADSGIVFVTSGGNCGDDNFHVSHNFVSGQQDTLRTIASYYGSQSIGQAIPIWGEPGKSFKMSFAMVSETDSVCLPWVNTEEGTFYLDSSLVAQNGDSLHFDLVVETANIFNNRPHVLLNVDKQRYYAIHIHIVADEGMVHAWNICNLANGAGNMGTSFSRGNMVEYTAGDNAYGIGEPACAEGCIAVAAHNADGIEPGYLASFSSKGPLIDGRRKPDVSAPGVNVISSISSYTTDYYQPEMTFRYASKDYIWAKMSGTSMSGPAVTGIVALMLEANSNLTPKQVRDILRLTARNDVRTGELHAADSVSDMWGWGKADALAAVNEALARVDIREADEEWFAKSLQVYPNPASGVVTILTGRHTPETVQIYSMNGQCVMSQEIVMEGRIDVSTLTAGVYVVKNGARTARLVVK